MKLCSAGELKPYPEMKESGVEWLGEVPAHWQVAMVKRHFAIRLGKMLQNSPSGSGDIEVPYLKAKHVQWFQVRRTDIPKMWANQGEIEQFGAMPNDLLVCEGGEGGRCGILKRRIAEGCIVQNSLHRVRPKGQNLNEFLQYVMSCAASKGWFDALNDRATIAHFTGEKFGALRAPIPPLLEQTAVVRFLDHADRRIRRYIRAKQKLIALLEEQQQAMVKQAVTGKIDVRNGLPYPSYKESGVKWLGDVPDHWELRRLKWVTRLQRGHDLPADRRVPGPFPVVSSGGVIDSHTEAKSSGPGVVMGRYGSTDAVYFVERDFWPHNTSLYVTDFRGNTKKWCYYLLRSITKADQAGKSAVPGIDRKDLFQIMVAVPPVREQECTVQIIEAATRSSTHAISLAGREIDLLHEYRTRLIADVVTGKLDVREAAAELPEEDLAEDTSEEYTVEEEVTG